MRKAPRQARSRVTVEAIVEAGARILSEQGWAEFTTNKVAEAAGVSVGSLYQYFPDKLSLIEAIRRRHLDDCLAIMRRSGEGEKSLERFVDDLVRDMFAAHSLYPGLHRVLLDEAPSFDATRDPHSVFEAEYVGHYAAAVSAYRASKEGASNRIMAMILSDVMDGVIHNAARRGMLGSAELRRELVRLLRIYLTTPDG